MSKLVTPEMDEFIRQHVRGTWYPALTELLNERFDTNFTKEQIRNYCYRNNLRNGLNGNFMKGHKPANKGKTWDEFMSPEGQENSRRTQFKPGNIPHNGGAPVGTIRLRRDHPDRRGGKPYYYEKTEEPNVWRPKHHLVWEEHNGPIPKGHNVQFANGNTLDYRIENLILVSKAQNAVRNRMGLKSADKATAETANAIADLKMRIAEIKRKSK